MAGAAMPDPRKMEKRQQVLADFGEFALRSDDLDAVLTKACELVAEAMQTKRAKVLEIEHDGATLFVRAGVGWGAGVVGHVRLKMSERSSETFSIAAGRPVITNDLAEEQRFEFPAFMTEAGVKALANVPIFLPGGQAFGLLQVDATEPRAFGDDDSQFLRTYAAILGPVIDRLIKAKALHRSEERFRAMVETAHDYAILTTDDHGVIETWSPGAEAIYGWSAAEMIGQPVAMTFAPEDRDNGEPARELAEARANGLAPSARAHLRKDGRRVFIEGVMRPLHAEGAVAIGFLKVGQDVTDRQAADKALRDSEAQLASELADAGTLQRLSTELISARNPLAIYQQLLQAAAALMRADFASIQMLQQDGRTLMLLAQINMHPQSATHWGLVDLESHGSCGEALRRGTRVIVPDVETWPVAAGTPDMDEFHRCGIRAIQTTPLVSRDGKIVGMISTHWRHVHHPQERDFHLFDVLTRQAADLIERTRAERALGESEERLRNAVEVGRLGLWDWNIVTGAVHWSDEYYRMQGYAIGEVEPSYESWLARIHPDDRAAAEAKVAAVMQTREEYVHEVRVLLPDGTLRWLAGRGRFFYDDEGRPVRMIGAMVDTTERRAWENRQTVLIGELQHRTRNLLGVVRSMADKTARASVDLADFRARFGLRLDALSRVQGLLSRLHDSGRVTFDDVIRSELAAMGADLQRVTLRGPGGVRLRSSTVQTLALALHELATNAVKYGAIGQADGHLAVTWSLAPPGADGRPRLLIDWRESHVEIPPRASPPRSGQGRELIERALPYQLNAETSYMLTDDGVHCTIAIPVSASAATTVAEPA